MAPDADAFVFLSGKEYQIHVRRINRGIVHVAGCDLAAYETLVGRRLEYLVGLPASLGEHDLLTVG